MTFARCAIAAVALAATHAHAVITDFRAWLDVHGSAVNSSSNDWYGTTGLNGPLMAASPTQWYSPGQPVNTPILAVPVDPGTNSGAAGPATFAGTFVHPGSGVPAVLVFAPQSPVVFGGMSVHSELIVNGLSGNGVSIAVHATISGVTTNLGSIDLAGTADDRLDHFLLPGGVVTMQPGDRVQIVIGDRGSYLYDHVNLNAWVTVPAPGAATAMVALVLARRRRRSLSPA